MIARRVLVLMLAAMLAVVVVGCGGGKGTEAPVTDPEPTTPPPVEETPVTQPDMGAQDVAPASLTDVFFAFDKSNLSGEARGTLERNASELKRDKDARIVIEGHCDERGTKSYNLALGEKRANAARDYLVSLGISASRVTVVSYGKERPFDSSSTEAAWARNRRAHFVVQ